MGPIVALLIFSIPIVAIISNAIVKIKTGARLSNKERKLLKTLAQKEDKTEQLEKRVESLEAILISFDPELMTSNRTNNQKRIDKLLEDMYK